MNARRPTDQEAAEIAQYLGQAPGSKVSCNCRKCGKEIAAILDAVCCECSYGRLHQSPSESPRDMVDVFARNRGQWLSGSNKVER